MALRIPSEDRIINYWDYIGGEPPEDFDPSNPTIVNADWIMKMMDKIVNGNYATKSFNIVPTINDLPSDAEQGQTAYVLNAYNKSSFYIYNGTDWVNIAEGILPTLQNGKVLSNDGNVLQWKDINWGDIKSNIYEQEDLFEDLTKGIEYDSTTATAIGGYKKGDRLLYTKSGIARYIESLVDNNTTEPSESNIWYINNIKYIEGTSSPTNPLPTASADTLGQVYGYWQSNASGYICEYNNDNYEWVYKLYSEIFTPYDTIYYRNTRNYGALYEVSANVYQLYQLGTSFFSSYVWVEKDLYHNTMPGFNWISLTLGASGSVYLAPADGWVLVGKKAGKTTTAWLQVSVVNSDGSPTSNGYYVNQYTYGNADVDMTLIFPIREGRYFTVAYTTTGDTMVFKFLYATNRRA